MLNEGHSLNVSKKIYNTYHAEKLNERHTAADSGQVKIPTWVID